MIHRFLALFLFLILASCSGGGGGGSPTAPPPPMNPPPPTGATVLRSTTFQGASGYNTAGSAAILMDGQAYFLELGEDFQTDNSPALEVRLCQAPDCRGDNLNLGDLMAFSGVQRYELMNAAGEYSHAVIWCRAVSLPFGYGVLQ